MARVINSVVSSCIDDDIVYGCSTRQRDVFYDSLSYEMYYGLRFDIFRGVDDLHLSDSIDTVIDDILHDTVEE